MTESSAGPVGGAADRYRVRVLQEAEADRAWKSSFQVPGDAKEMQFKLALLESCGSVPPSTARDEQLAGYLDIDCENVEGEWMYALEYSGRVGEREPAIVAVFYVNDEHRAACITHVVTAKEFIARRRAVLLRAADRALRHRLGGRAPP